MLSPLLWAPKAEENIFFSSLFLSFLREKRHMSYCCSGCGGLNMYNTSRHDHFLWLKPLKMAPYFFKPIDLLSKSVCICPEITCSFNPGRLRSSYNLLIPDTTQKQRCSQVDKNNYNILWLTNVISGQQVHGCEASWQHPLPTWQFQSLHTAFDLLVEILTGKNLQWPTSQPVKLGILCKNEKRKITIHLFLPKEIWCK